MRNRFIKPWVPLFISMAACDGSKDKNASEVRDRDTVLHESRKAVPESLKSGRAGPVDGPAVITGLRVAAHQGYDRVVIEFTGTRPDRELTWLRGSGTQCGSGADVAIKGTAALLIKLTPANAHTEAGTPSMGKLSTGPWSNILEIKQLCDFEADVQYLVSVRESVGVRVRDLEGPRRIVVDVGQ